MAPCQRRRQFATPFTATARIGGLIPAALPGFGAGVKSSASSFVLAAVLLAGVPLQAQEQTLPPLLDPLDGSELPPVDFGPPLVMPPVAPPPPDLLAPLEPLSGFNPAPREDFTFTGVAEEGVRYSVTITGLKPTRLDSQFRRISALYQGQGRPATPAQLASRTNADKALLQRLLFSEGWFGASTDATLSPSPDSRAKVELITQPADRYRWREITLDLIPDDKPELKQGFGLQIRDPIRAAAVEEAEGALRLKLTEAGYPFPEIGARDVVLDADTPTGTYLLTGDIGPPGRFGVIRLVGFQPFDEAHAQVIARFKPGDVYSSLLVDDLRRAMIDTQMFAGVTVTPVDTGEREADGSAITDIRINGNTGPLRRLSGQIGYSSGEGARAEALWRHRNLWKPQGEFTARLVIGTQEQRVAAEMAKRNFGQRDRTLSLLADITNIERPAFEARTVTLSGSLARLSTPIWQKRWTYSIGAEILASDELDLSNPKFNNRQVYFIAALPMSAGYDRSDDLLDPQKGFRLNLAATPEISRTDNLVASYGRIIGDASAYRAVRDNFVLAGRLRLGSIIGAEPEEIAPTRRLYAGGGGSVRGYDFQSIGPVGPSARPSGGRGLFEASLEGRYRFGDFGVVGFVDAGSLTEESVPTLSGTKLGIGVGGRYFTNFGPIRIDVARGLNRGPRDPKIGLYISIGQAF